jgi:hypothetical protein
MYMYTCVRALQIAGLLEVARNAKIALKVEKYTVRISFNSCFKYMKAV